MTGYVGPSGGRISQVYKYLLVLQVGRERQAVLPQPFYVHLSAARNIGE
jgi:hypothetical protein